MSKFGGSRNNKEVPGISSGSLSDIVFMLLFFFMVTTQMRESENKVVIKLPEASQSVKLERKDLASYINIGTPTRQYQAQYGTDARIQEATEKLLAEGLMGVILVGNVDMGIITDVKQELRRCSALRIMYQARKAAE